MLELKHIRKAYVTAGFTQVALDDVSVSFRDNEFVAVLGASGSGKTTMLNILGGLDHADSGDIVVSGISTKDYSDKDWDTYRNHRIGFIFQSYNLIPHQSVLSNVELALTLAGVSKSERTQRARAALERVGLGEHVSKRPSQLSGGQMQRVAIARALVNDPEIVLADEPTGALDTETGLQVMDLLKEIAEERLVIMVTHNPDLAEQYATRIVRLKDGRIIDDTDPIMLVPAGTPEPPTADPHAQLSDSVSFREEGHGEPAPASEAGEAPRAPAASVGDIPKAEPKDAAGARGARATTPKRHASMSFLTALNLSFNNLMTKKGRTFMTAFAGSIGIIGIAAILALSNGVNDYIARTEEQALSSYPLTITKSSFDLASLMMAGTGDEPEEAELEAEGADAQAEAEDANEGAGQEVEGEQELDTAAPIPEYMIMSDLFAQVKSNDLGKFKAFLESGDSGIEPYVSTIQYSYGLTPLIYRSDTTDGVVQLNPSKMGQTMTNGVAGSALLGGQTATVFQELPDDQRLLDKQMEVAVGRWPEAYDECVLVTTRGGWLSDFTLYSLGIHDPKAMEKMTNQALSGEEVEVPEVESTFSIDDAMGLTFKVVPATDLYRKNEEQGTWTDMSTDKDFLKDLVDGALEIKVVGVVHRAEDANSSMLSEGIAYSPLLTAYLMDAAQDAQIVREQKASPETDVFTGRTFEELQNDEKNEFDFESMFSVDEEALEAAFSFDTSALSGFGQGIDLSGVDLGSAMEGLDASQLSIDPSAFSGMLSEETLAQVMAGAPQFTLDGTALSVEQPELTDEQQKLLDDASEELSSGFMAWFLLPKEAGGYGGSLADLAGGSLVEPFAAYLATPPVQELLTKLGTEFGGEVEKVVNDVVQGYLTQQLAPYLSQAMTTLMTNAAQVMAQQMATQLQTQMAQVTGQIGTQLSNAIASQMAGQMYELEYALQNAFSVDADAFANAIQFNMTQEDLTSLLSNYMNADELTYSANLKKLGYASQAEPESISIYPKDFPSKEAVLGIIDSYNDRMEAAGDEDSAIQYSDFAGVLMGSVTDIVNTISLVLIAFVSISLVVSSIMISIITYISVLERKKEIGILRAMGASKLNVANIFNAETVIEGFFAGVLAIAVVYAASVPVNAYILETRNVANIMQLPWDNALTLIAVSVVLTLVAGLIPSSAAARRDPVEALRSE